MKHLAAFLLTAAVVLPPLSASAADGVTYPGKSGPGQGKHVVLLCGDEEYRSEEALPMLGQILSQRHGFNCTVLFAINPPGWSKRDLDEWRKANAGKDTPEPKPTDAHPKDGTIDPNESANIPGMEALDRADLVIMSWRFRKPTGIKHFDDYYLAGKPFIALRTSTHAFNGLAAPYAKYNWGNGGEWKGGFGRPFSLSTCSPAPATCRRSSPRSIPRWSPISTGPCSAWAAASSRRAGARSSRRCSSTREGPDGTL